MNRRLAPEVRRQLQRIEPTADGDRHRYWPCDVFVASGERINRVLFYEEAHYLTNVGDLDDARRFIEPRDVSAVVSSEDRLPPAIARRAGHCEFAMGGYAFELVFRDGRTIAFEGDPIADWVDLPNDLKPSDAVDARCIHPNDSPATGTQPEHSYCVFRSRWPGLRRT